jgi:hypothetical protein
MSMTAPIAAKDTVLTVAGTVQNCTDCTVKLDIGTWDATNTGTSGGWQEDGTDIKSGTISGTTVVDADSLKTFTIGTLGTASFSVTGEQTHSGSGRITSVSKKGGARGGMLVTFEFRFNGIVTTA